MSLRTCQNRYLAGRESPASSHTLTVCSSRFDGSSATLLGSSSRNRTLVEISRPRLEPYPAPRAWSRLQAPFAVPWPSTAISTLLDPLLYWLAYVSAGCAGTPEQTHALLDFGHRDCSSILSNEPDRLRLLDEQLTFDSTISDEA